mmetsp:Transcript_2290/g.3456  ORF Transcript_2290/g.3456 Transcript_2290/m.3456 type:complete len:155 (+) Transcript_2290:927-1391(+)
MSFKSKFVVNKEDDVSDADSAESQSQAHLQKFRLNETFDLLAKHSFKASLFAEKVQDAFDRLPDLESPDEEKDLVIKMGDFIELPLFHIQPISMLLAPLSADNVISKKMSDRLPNLYQHFRNLLEQRMDNDELSQREEQPLPLKRLLDGVINPE